MTDVDVDHLMAIRAAKSIVDGSTEVLYDAVKRARRSGLSWGQIATALGTSRQAAAERFGS